MAEKTMHPAVVFHSLVRDITRDADGDLVGGDSAQLKITKDNIICNECDWSIADSDSSDWHFKAALGAIVEAMQDHG
ncbi:hypothetical protein LCGC14_2040460 [marine sediment metagenome]|uniref:Uncharacterized protein n=1 Tax=marine sediment metagenome TaxID=412755 RepID=A0A0F9FEN6_9ZZZZ